MNPNHSSLIWRRLAAMLYDLFPILSIMIGVTVIAMIFTPGNEIPAGSWWHQLALCMGIYIYFVVSWYRFGQTIGMRAWRLKLISDHPVSWTRLSVRFLLSIISWLPVGLGYLRPVFARDCQSWHDSLTRGRLELIEKQH